MPRSEWLAGDSLEPPDHDTAVMLVAWAAFLFLAMAVIFVGIFLLFGPRAAGGAMLACGVPFLVAVWRARPKALRQPRERDAV